MFCVNSGSHLGFSRKSWPHVCALFSSCTRCTCPLVDIWYRYRDMTELSLPFMGHNWPIIAHIPITAEYVNDVISGREWKFLAALPSLMWMSARNAQHSSFLYHPDTENRDPGRFSRFRQDSNPRISVSFWATATGTPYPTQNFKLYKKG